MAAVANHEARNDFHSDNRKQSESSKPFVDLCNREDSNLCQKMREQDRLRDSLKHSDVREPVYLECSEAGDCRQESSFSLGRFSAPATKQLTRMSSEVQAVMSSGHFNTSLRQTPLTYASLALALAGTSPTYDAPMSIAKNDSYWESASRPNEIKLIERLLSGQGEISHAQLARTALEVCGNDSQLAMLTLANFTKNMAAIERRQINPSQIDPALRESYKQGNIDSLFHRIKGLADDPTEKYNKEGAIYHFYGAMFAGSQWGSISSSLVHLDNFLLDVSTESDRIKDTAGLMGARAGKAFFEAYYAKRDNR